MDFTVLKVKDKKTGETLFIKDFRFNPALHTYVGQVLEDKEPAALDLSTVIPGLTPEATTVEPLVAEESPKVVDAAADRFKELKKMKAWLKPELKAEYDLLKEVYGRKKATKGTDTSGTQDVLSQ